MLPHLASRNKWPSRIGVVAIWQRDTVYFREEDSLKIQTEYSKGININFGQRDGASIVVKTCMFLLQTRDWQHTSNFCLSFSVSRSRDETKWSWLCTCSMKSMIVTEITLIRVWWYPRARRCLEWVLRIRLHWLPRCLCFITELQARVVLFNFALCSGSYY